MQVQRFLFFSKRFTLSRDVRLSRHRSLTQFYQMTLLLALQQLLFFVLEHPVSQALGLAFVGFGLLHGELADGFFLRVCFSDQTHVGAKLFF